MRALFTVNRHHSATTRQVYTILDVIGDVGALYDSLNLIWALVLAYIFKISILLENIILQTVFRLKESELKLKPFTLSYWSWFSDAFRGLLYSIFCCLKKGKSTQSERIRAVGLRRVENELDAAKFIRHQLIYKELFRIMTTKLQRTMARRNYKLVVGESDQGTSSSSATDPDEDFRSAEAQGQIKNFHMTREQSLDWKNNSKIGGSMSADLPELDYKETDRSMVPRANEVPLPLARNRAKVATLPNEKRPDT